MSLISIKEARDILGDDASKFTDDELEALLLNLESIASMTINSILESKIVLPVKE